ncbi:hypothetical protein [Parasitella parasitica]|uniref:Arrestin C-terminal-like domain-containing protein n=1 Tax=Parasitella parasitica TaxID=35722 RepID=A0A0B7MXU6_9FUNG|nr:hypothetical protein [Parasitella parasitica]
MNCCRDPESSSASQDFLNILSNMPNQYIGNSMPSYQPQSQETTRMKVSLDLPGYQEYLPTYMPGQLITGNVRLQVECPIKVTHLKIALFGNVQVYGEQPGYPVTNGLFDYQRNEQLINTGLRIVKQSNGGSGHQLVCKRDESQNSNQQAKRQKTAQDRHIEKLIRQVASIDHTTNVSHGSLNDVPTKNYSTEEGSTFDLDNNSYQVRFSIRVPTSRRLSGTFDHPHYPVSYRIVAIMKYKDIDGSSNESTCYSTVRLCLEPFFDIHQFQSPIQTAPTSQYVQCRDSVWNNICTHLLNYGAVSMYSSKLPKQIYTSSIEAHLELSTQAFERSQYIPLQLKLANHAFANFNISVVKINIELVRRINMVCSMNEQVESQVVQSASLVFKSSLEKEQQLFFRHTKLSFDLSNHIQVPTDSVCTISSASTKDVFSLGYDLRVELDITGVTSNSSTRNYLSLDEEKNYVADQQHHIWQQEESQYDLPSEPYHHKFKTYSLELDPLTVVVVNNSIY